MKNQRGFTLIELMIAITLVSVISTGMLIAMRTSLITMEKTENRLQSNRRVMAVQDLLVRQIAGVMPSVGACGGQSVPLFAGSGQSLRMVTSYSLEAGARGYPQLLQLQVVPDPRGGLRLIENEHLFFSNTSSSPFCAPDPPGPESFEIAGELAACTFSYREYVPEDSNGGNWVGGWTRPNLPSAIRIQITPLHPDPARLTIQTVHVPISINREVLGQYDDQ